MHSMNADCESLHLLCICSFLPAEAQTDEQMWFKWHVFGFVGVFGPSSHPRLWKWSGNKHCNGSWLCDLIFSTPVWETEQRQKRVVKLTNHRADLRGLCSQKQWRHFEVHGYRNHSSSVPSEDVFNIQTLQSSRPFSEVVIIKYSTLGSRVPDPERASESLILELWEAHCRSVHYTANTRFIPGFTNYTGFWYLTVCKQDSSLALPVVWFFRWSSLPAPHSFLTDFHKSLKRLWRVIFMSTNPNVHTSISCLLILQELYTPMDASWIRSVSSQVEFMIADANIH